MAQTCKFEHPLSWVARLAAIPPGNASQRWGAGTMDEYRPCLSAWDSHTWASEPCKELVSSHCSSAVAPSNECQWHGLCLLCLLWQLTLKYFLPPERLQACTRRCQMQAHDPVSTDGPVGPCTPVRLVQVELSKGDARSPESSESPPSQCNAREPFRKREPPKLSWPRLTVDDVLLIQCWGGAFSQCFKF